MSNTTNWGNVYCQMVTNSSWGNIENTDSINISSKPSCFRP